MRSFKNEDIERETFISAIMVGCCPNCKSGNVHDCSKVEYVPGPQTAIARERLDGVSVVKDITRAGSDCPIAKELDDPSIGHCDDCNFLWCLECGLELSIDEPTCGHWAICGECGKTELFPSTCPYKAEVDAGELVVNPCLLECPNVHECSKCPYAFEREDCPKIKTRKEAKNRY